MTAGAGRDPARPAPTWRDLLGAVQARLRSPVEARWIVERASGWEGAELWLHLDERAPLRAVPFVEGMVERRSVGEPLQYVLGRWRFRGLDLLVDRRVLIPRPETEIVAGAVVSELGRIAKARPRVVELGTGSGAIALAVAAEVPGARVWATDAAADALAVARANLAGLGSGAATRVRLLHGPWWDALPWELRGGVDIVVCNPPYVAAGEELPAEVADWEPVGALRAGPTGLEALEIVVEGAPRWLDRPGALVVEIAPHQTDAVRELAGDAGFTTFEVWGDLTGRPRVVVARLDP